MNVTRVLWARGAPSTAKLAKTVAKAGKGKTLRPDSKTRPEAKNRPDLKNRPEPKKLRTVQPTTLDMGNFGQLQSVSLEERTIHKNTLAKVASFDALRLTENVRKNVLNLIDEGPPTPIQKVAIKALRKPRQPSFKTWLMAAETGSGKTLAYLAPLMSDLEEEKRPRTSTPFVRSMILVPTKELVDQVVAVARAIAPQQLKISTAASQATARGVDLLVCSPAALKPLLKSPALQYCRTVVVDEADTLMDYSFNEETLAAIEACPQLTDLVFCSATIPRFFEKILRQKFPDATRLVTPSIHRLPRHIDFRVIEVFRKPYNDNKQLALQQALYAIYHDNTEPELTKRVLVFVNAKGDAQPLAKALRDVGYDATGVDGSLDRDERKQALQAFLEPPTKLSDDPHSKLKVLVATDIVARGVDMNRVRNVVLYDLPRSSADLLHRAGRTGRLGAKGRVLLFVSKRDSHGWVRGLQTVVRKGQALA